MNIILCFSPIIPHFANECLDEMGFQGDLSWPEFKKSFLISDDIKLVIQINGKKRSILNTKKGINELDVIRLVEEDKIIEKYLKDKTIKKTIFVKDRLINFLVNE